MTLDLHALVQREPLEGWAEDAHDGSRGGRTHSIRWAKISIARGRST